MSYRGDAEQSGFWVARRTGAGWLAAVGRPRTSFLRFVHAILYALKTRCQRANFPKDFPPKSSVHGHSRAWTRDRVSESIHSRLRAFARTDDGRHCRPATAIFDSQTVRFAGLAEGAGYERFAESATAWIHLALIRIMLRSLA